jgi:methionyl-tRNA formyltransferase
VSWAIYHGETSYGVTVHWMEPGIDTGDLASQATFPLEESDTPLRLMHKCVQAGVPLLLSLLETAATAPGAIPRTPQDLSRRRYFGKRAPQGGLLDWRRPAAEIVNFVRACDYSPFPSPWGHPATTIAGREVEVIRAARTYQPCTAPPGTLGQCDDAGAFVAATDEWVAVRRLRAGGRTAAPIEMLEGVLP